MPCSLLQSFPHLKSLREFAVHQSHHQRTMPSCKSSYIGTHRLVLEFQINHCSCCRQSSKRCDSSLSLQGTNTKVLVAPPSCLRRSNLFLRFKFSSHPRVVSRWSLTMPVPHEPSKQLLLGVIAQLTTERLATVNLTNDLTFHRSRIGVINPLTIQLVIRMEIHKQPKSTIQVNRIL